MAINIKNPEVDRLLRQLAERTGESMTDAMLKALRERLARTERGRSTALKEELEAIRKRCRKLRVRDRRSPEEIIGYDEHGLPR